MSFILIINRSNCYTCLYNSIADEGKFGNNFISGVAKMGKVAPAASSKKSDLPGSP
jgi:hypothetical protein